MRNDVGGISFSFSLPRHAFLAKVCPVLQTQLGLSFRLADLGTKQDYTFDLHPARTCVAHVAYVWCDSVCPSPQVQINR